MVLFAQSAAADPWFWHVMTRFGDVQILLPAMLAAQWWWLRCGGSRSVVARWVGWLALAVVLTTLTKIAFIGWGLGSAALDFTGISGHSMFAAAVLPPLWRMLGETWAAPWRRLAPWLGVLMAALVAVSRVEVLAHSPSEAVAGFLLGGLVSAMVLWRPARPPVARSSLALLVVVLVWWGVTVRYTPQAPTHGLVVAMALKLSGRMHPWTREHLHAGSGEHAAKPSYTASHG